MLKLFSLKKGEFLKKISIFNQKLRLKLEILCFTGINPIFNYRIQ